MYVSHPQPDCPRFTNKFRQRFRVPYSEFLSLLSLVKDHVLFIRWLRRDATGKESSPIELLLLGSLRYLGRGWTFDDLEESTGINEETHRQFFHVFISWGSSSLYKSMLRCLLPLKKLTIALMRWQLLVSMAVLDPLMQHMLVLKNVLGV